MLVRIPQAVQWEVCRCKGDRRHRSESQENYRERSLFGNLGQLG